MYTIGHQVNELKRLSPLRSHSIFSFSHKAASCFEACLLFLRQWKVYVLLRFRHKQAQARTQDEKIGPQFAGSLCRY